MPAKFVPSDQCAWSLRILDNMSMAVDKSRGCINMDGKPGSNNSYASWGLYDMELPEMPRQLWGELLPYSLTLTTSFVTFVPLTMPIDVNVPVRLSCPLGFSWDKSLTGFWQSFPPGATADFPPM